MTRCCAVRLGNMSREGKSSACAALCVQENYFLDDGAYAAIKVVIEVARQRVHGGPDIISALSRLRCFMTQGIPPASRLIAPSWALPHCSAQPAAAMACDTQLLCMPWSAGSRLRQWRSG